MATPIKPKLIPTAQALLVLGIARASFDRYAAKAQIEPDLKGLGRTSGQFYAPSTLAKLAKANGITPDWSVLEG